MRIMMVAAFAAAAMLCGQAVPAKAEDSDFTLRVASYGGAFADVEKKYAADAFTRRTGIKVEFVVGNPSDFLAQMIASRGRKPPYDVAFLDDAVQTQAIKSGVLQKLDPAIVTNLKLLYPEVLNKEGYGPGMLLYSVGIAYNKVKLKEAGIAEPTSWNDLWDAKLAGHVAIPDISIIMGRDLVIKLARLNGGDEAHPEKGIARIAELKAQSFYTSSTTLTAQLQSGDVWAAPWTNGRAWAMIDQGLPIGYVLPKEGAIGNLDTVDLVAGGAHAKEAQTFINFVLDPLAQIGMANELPYGPTNKVLAPVLAAYPDLARKFPASPEDLHQLYLPDWPVFDAHLKAATDFWNHQIQR